jgi:transposase-like protein
VYVTDGGKGVIKALKMSFGKHLLHQRCTVHKHRNILSHLPEKYRPEASRRFRHAMDMVNYQDAQRELSRHRAQESVARWQNSLAIESCSA